jgi:hypothetical protein
MGYRNRKLREKERKSREEPMPSKSDTGGVPLMPVIKPTHKILALQQISEYVTRYGSGKRSGLSRVPYYRINHRLLERSKFAPWGRGAQGVAHG